jgi:NADPH-dependent curcumin reductase CurA
MDFMPRYPEGREQLAKWIGEGKIKRRYHVVNGIEKCPEALKMLFEGVNTGKLWVISIIDRSK